MHELFNSDRVLKTLDTVLPILKSNTTHYWFMGSMVPTALNGSLFRDVHDFDIIITTNNRDALLRNLYNTGYIKKPLNFFRVSELMGVYVFSHPTLLDIGFFIINDEPISYTIRSGPVSVEIPKKNLASTTYTLHDRKFIGIDASYSYALSNLAKRNPKRAKELLLFKSLRIVPAKWPIYTFYLFGFKANWIIDGLNTLLVVIGNLRVKRGLPYDPWQ